MEELNKKIADLERENSVLRQQLSAKENISNSVVSKDILNKSEPSSFQQSIDLQQMLSYLKTVLGYNIQQLDNRFILRSVYAFCEEDVFEIEISSNRLIFKNTEYLAEHQEEFDLYVRKGKSYSAFFAAVTLNLFNKKTFG